MRTYYLYPQDNESSIKLYNYIKPKLSLNWKCRRPCRFVTISMWQDWKGNCKMKLVRSGCRIYH